LWPFETRRGEARLVVASNRGPISVTAVDDGEDQVDRGGGGLVSGLLAALKDRDDVVWVCAALNDAERALMGAENVIRAPRRLASAKSLELGIVLAVGVDGFASPGIRACRRRRGPRRRQPSSHRLSNLFGLGVGVVGGLRSSGVGPICSVANRAATKGLPPRVRHRGLKSVHVERWMGAGCWHAGGARFRRRISHEIALEAHGKCRSRHRWTELSTR